ncbi:MAG: hypothetical protein KBF28_05385 [Gemmatimonadales bacterium]|nr:hypothetical protein [Gemmatimonadales bacterium]
MKITLHGGRLDGAIIDVPADSDAARFVIPIETDGGVYQPVVLHDATTPRRERVEYWHISYTPIEASR